MQRGKQIYEQRRNKEYNDYVEQITPRYSMLKNMAWAFVTGGAICAIGQGIMELFLWNGFSKQDANSYMIIILVASSVLLTGLNIYPKIGNFAGAGTLVPITGFANSIASSAIEFRAEGFIFGVGCRIFNIAGPVILYGITASWVVGIIYWLL